MSRNKIRNVLSLKKNPHAYVTRTCQYRYFADRLLYANWVK
jgi:hypothetical protein